MINTSNEFKNVISGRSRQFYGGAEITLADSTVLNLDNTRIIGLKIEDATSSSGTFSVGSAIINKCTLSINNSDDAYSDYDFTDAVIRPAVGLQLSETIETLSKGVFTADDPKVVSSVITLTALDNMVKFDKPFSDIVQVFPCTAQDLLDTVCTHCGVVLGTLTFFNHDYVIQTRPTDDAVNCREIVSWIAQIAGCFARINTSGALEIKWYDFESLEDTLIDGGRFDETTEASYQSGDTLDGGNFTDYTSGGSADGGNFTSMSAYHHIYSLSSLTLSTDDVVITGVQVQDASETPQTVLFGVSGYVISLTGNKLIQSQSDAQTVANTVGGKLVGMRFRPCSLTAISDPSREAGDIAYITDRKQNTYQIFLSSVSFGIGQMDKISCDAESPSRNSATRYDVVTKAIIDSKKHTDTKLTAYDLMVQQLSNLISHSFGFYSSEEILTDGSKIYYKHDKPTRAESMKIWKETIDAFAVSTDGGVTWNAGFDVDGNAVFNVLSAIGINADWIRAGKLLSNDGATLIDMAYGVANSDNISFTENIQSGFPLTMPFNIDDSVSKINKVLLKFTQQAFRTYSDTASSGGGTSSTTSVEGSTTNTSSALDGSYYGAMSGNNLSTSGASGTTISHTHTVNVAVSGNIGGLGHVHSVPSSSHSHSFTVPTHTHNLNFGIKEQAISNNEITVYVDGTLRATTSDTQGIVDLTAYITTVGWHTIEVKSTTLKRISAQVVIKSYIRS